MTFFLTVDILRIVKQLVLDV